MIMNAIRTAIGMSLLGTLTGLSAPQQTQPATTVATVPRVVRINGGFRPGNGVAAAPVESVTFSIYKDETDRTLYPVLDVTLVSPALTRRPRAWVFQPDGLPEFTAVMKGWKIALSRSERPRISPATKPLATPVKNPKNVFFSVMPVATHKLFSFRARHLAKSPFSHPLNIPILDLMQLRIRKLSKICDGFDTK